MDASTDAAPLADATMVSRCIPGVYEANLVGSYRSSLSGIPGVVAPFAGPNQGTFLFSLEQSASPEFFNVGNGCLRSPAGSPVDGAALLTGRVDCYTGAFTGQLSGFYVTEGQRVFFRGTLRAMYDPALKGFVDGVWDAREQMVLVGEQPGGKGTWSAVPGVAAVPGANPDACLDGVEVPAF